MEKQQELEWMEAQNIVLSKDLVSAAKQQLKFLAAVDEDGRLYDGPTLDYAIYRYKHQWLPLLAKYTKSRYQEGPLVVPLDCEWIWHCHRLNPVQYITDCEKLYGTILDNRDVVSSLSGLSTSLTEEIWNTLYPNEAYKLNYIMSIAGPKADAMETTTYDLVSAVKRQSSFYYQVSKPHMNEDVFLEEAVARYKGFLYLIKKNKKNDINQFCVPTYDIDLIWHSHQLHPTSYFKDSMVLLGEILEHDDMDSDRTKGKKLDIGFCKTTKFWEETFGSRYLRAGVMYRGTSPNLVTMRGYESNSLPKEYVEVLMEIVDANNLPSGHGQSLFVSITKNQADSYFNTKRTVNIWSEHKEKQLVAFKCEPTGEILIELISPTLTKTLGTTVISLDNFFNPISKLSHEKWFELLPISKNELSEKTSLRIALSFTPPIKTESGHFKHLHQVLETATTMKKVCDHKGWSEGGTCTGGCGGGCGSRCGGGSRCGSNCGGGCNSK